MSGPTEPAGQPSARPRNYLEQGERRRLLWRFMPAALALVVGLTVVEQVWFRQARAPRPRSVDTRLEAIRGPAPSGAEVLIEAEPAPFVPGPGELAASPEMLEDVRDDTFFRAADVEAWLQVWKTLIEAGPAGMRAAEAQPVTYGELFGQPRSFRGRLVRMKGTLHRLEQIKAPDNHYGIENYWQGWLEPASGPVEPVVVHFRQLPEGMPTGLKIHESVEVVGYFLKRHAYAAADAVRVAPLLMALEPAWKPLRLPAAGGTTFGTWALVAMGAVVAATIAAASLSGRRPRAPDPGPSGDLSAALADVEPFSASAALRRLAEEEEREAVGGRPSAETPA
jgi:hypothetical protein